MKSLRLFPALLLVLTASCQKEQTNDVLNTQGLTISSRTMAMNGETASPADWQNGDCMGVFFGDESSAVKFTYDGGSWSTATTSVSAGSTIAAYTPWNDESDRNSVTILENQSTAGGIRNSDFLYAEGNNATIKDNALNLTFDHRLSQLIVEYTYAEGMTNVAPANVKILNQPLTYSKSGDTWAASGDANSVTPFVNHGTNGGTIEAILVPHTVESGTEFMTFTVNEIPYTITAGEDWVFEPGKCTTLKKLSISPDNAQILNVTCSVGDWHVTEASGALTEIYAGYEYDESTNTYYIYNAKGLEKWRAAANDDASVNAKLMNDIVLPELSGTQTSNWASIGRTESQKPSYDATFDGNGKKISNIIMESNWSTGAGFIANMSSNGVVKNLTLEYTSLKCTNTAVSTGGIVGKNVGGTIEGCAVKGNIQGGSYAGGIVGNNTGKVTGCILLDGSTISSVNATGGIIGWSANTSATTIRNCHVYSVGEKRTIITATSGTSGGIIGEMKDAGSTIEACSVDADIIVSAGTKALGGIIGIINNGSYTYNVNGCYYNGTLSSTTSKILAGIVGNFTATSLNITSCYSMAGWNSGNENNVQGILGAGDSAKRTVTSCYSTTRCGTNIGTRVDAITSEQATSMNGSLTNWEYVAAPQGNVFPFVIQPKN